MRLALRQSEIFAGRVAALAMLAFGLAGCQGVTGIQPVAQVRVIDASPDAPALDIYQNAQGSLYNVGFGTVSSYMAVTPGAYIHSATIAGTQQQLALAKATLAAGGQYTVLAGNIAAGLQMAVLKDQAFPAPAGQTGFRFLNEATRSGSVDLYLLPAGYSLNGVAPIAAGLPFGAGTGYINAPSGTYSVVAYPAGAVPNAVAPAFTGSQVSYPATSVRTILLLDAPAASPGGSRSGLQIVTADDYDTAG